MVTEGNGLSIEERIKAIVSVHEEAAKSKLGKGNGGVGEMPCPICGAPLHFTVSGYNGHIWGTCTTPGCLHWVE